MKDAPIVPRGAAPPLNWAAGMWPALIGGGALIAAMYGMGLFGKDRKMTKLEKAFVSLVIALGEKLEETEKRRHDLSEELAETDKKLIAETRRAESAEAKVKEAESRITETIQRVDAAEVRVREVEAAADARIRELEADLRAMREARSMRSRPSGKSHRR